MKSRKIILRLIGGLATFLFLAVVALYALGATTLVATWNLLRLGREAQRETC